MPQQGRLRELYLIHSVCSSISIHAPTGATSPIRPAVLYSTSNFNPRPNRGDFVLNDGSMYDITEFQSTPQQGRLPGSQRHTPTPRDFNPRPNRGDFKNASDPYWYFTISIHAPTGATSRHGYTDCCECGNFNPRPNRGDFCIVDTHEGSVILFQSTPQQGRLNG